MIQPKFEHVIRYEDGIKSDFVFAINYDYTTLDVETHTVIMDQPDDNTNVGDMNVGNKDGKSEY